MDTIRILGGGISGLTAALNLKKAGISVEVHERESYCGKHTNDFQFLENWTSNEDVLESLGAMNVATEFYMKPWHSQEFLSPTLRKYIGTSNKPLMYLVKRGKIRDSIDESLERQVKESKIRIIYNSNLKHHDADIIATGLKKPSFVVTGIKFKFNHPDRSIVLLDNFLSRGCYSYFIVNDNTGEIACANPTGLKNFKERLDLTIKKFEKVLNKRIDKVEERFAAVISFGFLKRSKVNGQYYVGEAAGFQDHLAGFGMVYAFESGYYAAKSIIENVDYDSLWRGGFLRQLKISSKNRALYERLSNDDFERIIDILNSKNPIIRHFRGGNDLQFIMRRLYNHSISFFPVFCRSRFIQGMGCRQLV